MAHFKRFEAIAVITILFVLSMTACKPQPSGSSSAISDLVSTTISSSEQSTPASSNGSSFEVSSGDVISYNSNDSSKNESTGKSSSSLKSSSIKNSNDSSSYESLDEISDSITPEVRINVFTTSLLSKTGKIINNIFSQCGIWYGSGRRVGQWNNIPANSLINKFPFVKHYTLHASTGGGPEIDLYVDHTDPLKGMNFAGFNSEISSVLNQGIKPYIKIGSVPSILSNDANNGGMGLNRRPPTTAAQWNLYYVYVKSIAQNVVDTFGLTAARSWQWGCFSEANNGEWFETSDGNSVNTRNAYFKLYDFTVAAVQSVLGANQFSMGTHILGHVKASDFSFVKWDELDFIDHCATGTNYYTGGKGTQLNFIAVSHYDNSPGDPGKVRSFTEIAERLKNKATSVGLTIKIGVDEYGLIADQNGKELVGSRTVGDSWETSKTASDFKELLDSGYDYVSIWSLMSSWNDFRKDPNNVLTGARLNQANVAALTYKMAGSDRLKTEKSGKPASINDNVNIVSSYNASTKTAYIFIFNHSESLTSTTSEKVSIKIDGIIVNSGSTAVINEYILDSTHSNWFYTWWKDRGSIAVTDYSPYDVIYPNFLKYSEDIAIWNKNVSRYAKISEIGDPIAVNSTPVNNSLKIDTELAHHSAVLYEIKNVKSAE
ncbi:MAG: GH39 family glycosyl hydrolase [Saccharofermentanales bacterium]